MFFPWCGKEGFALHKTADKINFFIYAYINIFIHPEDGHATYLRKAGKKKRLDYTASHRITRYSYTMYITVSRDIEQLQAYGQSDIRPVL
jgi:hypothetical protein